jgi:hypothetical protein
MRLMRTSHQVIRGNSWSIRDSMWAMYPAYAARSAAEPARVRCSPIPGLYADLECASSSPFCPVVASLEVKNAPGTQVLAAQETPQRRHVRWDEDDAVAGLELYPTGHWRALRIAVATSAEGTPSLSITS